MVRLASAAATCFPPPEFYFRDSHFYAGDCGRPSLPGKLPFHPSVDRCSFSRFTLLYLKKPGVARSKKQEVL